MLGNCRQCGEIHKLLEYVYYGTKVVSCVDCKALFDSAAREVEVRANEIHIKDI